MLTKTHRVYHWIRPGRSISSDRLEPDCLQHLARAIAVYRRMVGRARGEVRNAARAALAGLRPDRIEAVVELLDEAAGYEWPRASQQAALRLRVFEAASHAHPVVDSDRGRELLKAHAGIDGSDPVPALYADYPEFHRLVTFPADHTAEILRAEYDLAQAQALLYDAVRMTVDASGDYRHIIQYARLSRLLHRLTRARGAGWRLVFDGPNSVLRRTRVYGVDFARFLAALVQARGWRMEAEIALRKGWAPVGFSLSDADGLQSRVPAPRLFDSKLEEALAGKFGPRRDEWRLAREAVILEAGEALLVPDFVFTHDDGTQVLLEIVGYWTPEYLEEKLAKLAAAAAPNMIVAVRKSLALRAGSLPATVLPFGSRILLKDLLPRLEGFRPATPDRGQKASAVKKRRGRGSSRAGA
jgi:predicted nuclease of restriction endonuclease-like RecB superfamily